MKTAIFFSTLAFSFMLVTIEAYSEPDCSYGCNERCPELPQCKCGTYKDYCGCCSYCLKCPGDQCILPANERCGNGTRCRPRPGAVGSEYFNGPAWCTSESDWSRENGADHAVSKGAKIFRELTSNLLACVVSSLTRFKTFA